jgi:hypothetical protein
VVEARLALKSIYFATSMPPVSDPNAGLVESQQQTLVELAADFKKYLESKPGAHLLLVGHADPRGRTRYDQELSERRAGRVKKFLVEQGIPEGNIDTQAFGALHALTDAAVKDAIENDPQLSAEERYKGFEKHADDCFGKRSARGYHVEHDRAIVGAAIPIQRRGCFDVDRRPGRRSEEEESRTAAKEKTNE